MRARLRSLARRLLGVRRVPAYYLPWLTRPGLECVVLINNVESRFTSGRDAAGLQATVTQHDADGRVVAVQTTTLADSADAREVRLVPTAAGHGFVTVEAPRIRSDLYVALVDGMAYTATHGRQEFIEHYPAWTRAALALAGGLLALAGRTIPAFARDQYVYDGPGSRSHLLLMNLSNVVNCIRVATTRAGRPAGARLLRLPPLGAALVDVGGPARTGGPLAVDRVRLTGNAWFNLYLVGAGRRGLDGALSLMHVK
ncbi:MAG TPA: hypothetical protein VFV05_14000 [Methylomirabilota bacterium]|nr:hypothetical protein [Methylomirabilota bacterium]